MGPLVELCPVEALRGFRCALVLGRMSVVHVPFEGLGGRAKLEVKSRINDANSRNGRQARNKRGRGGKGEEITHLL